MKPEHTPPLGGLQAEPDGRGMSVGHTGDEPLQTSCASQGPADARHTVPLGESVSTTQVVELPEQARWPVPQAPGEHDAGAMSSTTPLQSLSTPSPHTSADGAVGVPVQIEVESLAEMRQALDAGATRITEGMKLAAAEAIGLDGAAQRLLNRTPGQAFNAEDLTASVLAVQNAFSETQRAARNVAQLRGTADSADAVRQFGLNLAFTSALVAQANGATAEAGRALGKVASPDHELEPNDTPETAMAMPAVPTPAQIA